MRTLPTMNENGTVAMTFSPVRAAAGLTSSCRWH
jgi:hypothetical protein